MRRKRKARHGSLFQDWLKSEGIQEEANAAARAASSQLPDLIPERKAWLRAVVAAIPAVGGALDHLLFDKADSICFPAATQLRSE